MRRMLDTKEAGLPSTIEFDKEGNRKVGKNLGVDGKLTLKSLVSGTNPDGDITKELGGGGSARHGYSVFINDTFHYEVYTTKDYSEFTIQTPKNVSDFKTNDKYKELRKAGKYPAAGYFLEDTTATTEKFIVSRFEVGQSRQYFYITGYSLDESKFKEKGVIIKSAQVIKLY